MREELRQRIELGCAPIASAQGVEVVCANDAVRALYGRRDFVPAWSDEGGPSPAALSLAEALAAASEHGLRADDYHLPAIRERLAALAVEPGAEPPERLRARGELDVLLTDAFLLYGAHLLAGRVDPETIHPDWISNPRTADVAAVLERAIVSGRPQDELEALAPGHPEYRRLRRALATYRTLAATGWAAVSEGPTLQTGDRDDRASELRARLRAEGYEIEPSTEPEALDLFDAPLAEALRRFQSRHELAADGLLGPRTVGALNVSAADRVRQLEVNLERWRWMPQELGERHVRIDVARFRLHVFERARPVLSMSVVVGKPFTRTPSFSSTITHLVVNPSWNVPRSIATTEVLADARRSPSYLVRNGFRVFRDAGRAEVDPLAVDWAKISPETLNLTFRQLPGPRNALGRIKFLLPNRFGVYLHDTPSRRLFNRESRAFSHGCIRLERPRELAEYLMGRDPRWPRDRLDKALRAGEEVTYRVPEPIPVHLLYHTAWVEEDGTVHFVQDLYGRDAEVAAALEAPAPGRRAED